LCASFADAYARDIACRPQDYRPQGYDAQVPEAKTDRRRRHGKQRTPCLSIAHGAGDPLERFRIETVPTLVVVENKAVMARLERPQGCREIEGFLAPWLN
jgi:hypothetical protein